MFKRIDLHVHTTASDGSISPSQVVQAAVNNKLAAIAITDHDTVKGIQEAILSGRHYGIEVIPGIELSVDFKVEMHILGYFIDPESRILSDKLEELKFYRDQRNPQIIKKLHEYGLEIDLGQVQKKANGGTIGRPHIAAVMVEKGYVSSIEEAFDRYLGLGRFAYVPKKKLSPAEGIQLIKEVGGIAVLAHPVYLEREHIVLKSLLEQLVEYQLDGIEAYYSDHTADEQKRYIALAEEYGLVVTGGSDFHGQNKSNIQLGIGYGNLQIPYKLIKRLKELLCINPRHKARGL